MSENQEAKKGKGGAIGAMIGTLVLAVACAVGGWVANDLWPKRPPVMPQMPQMTATVAVKEVEERTYNLPEKFVAHAEAMQEVDLLPQVDGYIKEIKFKEGDIVKAGATLYVLDDERYRAVANQRKADLEAAEAEARRGQGEGRRPAGEGQPGGGGVRPQEGDRAGADQRADRQDERARGRLRGAVEGRARAHRADRPHPRHLPAHRPRLHRLARGAEEGQGPDGSEYREAGTWDFDDNEMSKDTATIIMRLSFPNPDRLLIPNSYVTLLTDRKTPPKMASIPQQALFDLTGGSQGVWVLKDDETVEQRVVEVREMSEGWSPVISGLKTGEKVVISGHGKLAPGMKVKVVEPTMNDDLDPNYQPPVKEK